MGCMTDGKKRIDLAKYTNKIISNPTSSFNSYESKTKVEDVQIEKQPLPNIAPKGHDQVAKGIRQMMAHFDYQTWADQVGSSGVQNSSNQYSTTTLKQQRHSQLSQKEIRELKKRREQTKKKFKYEWLYKDTNDSK